MKDTFFSFLGDFEPEYSSVTISSAYNIQKLLKSKPFISKKKNLKELEFSEIHENNRQPIWSDYIFESVQNKFEKIGLPLYCLHKFNPTNISKVNELNSTKNNSLGFFFFFFFFFGEEFSLESYEISSAQIEALYGTNNDERELATKNLIIINYNKQRMERKKKLERFFPVNPPTTPDTHS